jgi:peptidyl-prolyl cis-trans isomerase D
VIAFAEVRDRVAADWTAARTAEALTVVAEGFRDEVAGGLTLADLAGRVGREVESVLRVARDGSAPGVPAALVTEVFDAEEGAVLVHADGDEVVVARISAIEPFDPRRPENVPIVEALNTRFRQAAAGDMLALFTAALRNQAGVYVNEDLIETTLAQFQ